MTGLPTNDPTPEEAARLREEFGPGPLPLGAARLLLAMEDGGRSCPVIRYNNGDWALLKEEGRDVYFLAALLPEPDGPCKWRVDAERDVAASADDLRSLATLILGVLDGGIGGKWFGNPAAASL